MKRRSFLIGILAVFSFLILGVVELKPLPVYAESVSETTSIKEEKEEISETTISWLENSFAMNYGASVRVGDTVTDESGNVTYENYGIRFSVTAKTTEAENAFANIANSDAIAGVLIAPSSSLTNVMSAKGISDKNQALTAKTVFEDGWYDFAETGKAWTDTTIYNLVSPIKDNTLYGAIINLKTANFLQKYTGVAYIGVPKTYSQDGSVATYTYYFAKYAEGTNPITGAAERDASHNTRCMYYIAQKAMDESDPSAEILQKSYIDAFATAYPEVVNNTQFKYTVVHHYVTGYDGLNAPIYTTKEEKRGGLLNELVHITNDLVLTTDGKEAVYPYNDFSTAGKNKGVVYAGSMQVLHVYYDEKIANDSGSTEGGGGSTEGTEPETPKKTVSELLSASDASTKYFDDTLVYVDGQLVSTDGETGEGQKTVVFTAKFLYDLQQNGYTTITIPTLYSTTKGSAAWLFPTSSVKMTGYEGANGTYSIESKEIDGVTYTYIPDSITISLDKKLEYNETDEKYYYEGTTTEVTGISIQPYSWASGIAGTRIGRDWVFEDLVFE